MQELARPQPQPEKLKRGDRALADLLDTGDPLATLGAAILWSTFQDLHSRRLEYAERFRAERFTESHWFETICAGLDLDSERWRRILQTGRLN